MGGDLNPLVVVVLAEKRRDTYTMSKKATSLVPAGTPLSNRTLLKFPVINVLEIFGGMF